MLLVKYHYARLPILVLHGERLKKSITKILKSMFELHSEGKTEWTKIVTPLKEPRSVSLAGSIKLSCFSSQKNERSEKYATILANNLTILADKTDWFNQVLVISTVCSTIHSTRTYWWYCRVLSTVLSYCTVHLSVSLCTILSYEWLFLDMAIPPWDGFFGGTRTRDPTLICMIGALQSNK